MIDYLKKLLCIIPQMPVWKPARSVLKCTVWNLPRISVDTEETLKRNNKALEINGRSVHYYYQYPQFFEFRIFHTSFLTSLRSLILFFYRPESIVRLYLQCVAGVLLTCKIWFIAEMKKTVLVLTWSRKEDYQNSQSFRSHFLSAEWTKKRLYLDKRLWRSRKHVLFYLSRSRRKWKCRSNKTVCPQQSIVYVENHGTGDKL